MQIIHHIHCLEQSLERLCLHCSTGSSHHLHILTAESASRRVVTDEERVCAVVEVIEQLEVRTARQGDIDALSFLVGRTGITDCTAVGIHLCPHPAAAMAAGHHGITIKVLVFNTLCYRSLVLFIPAFREIA